MADSEYVFMSNGGCTRCDAMDGRLSDIDPMPRPHPNCTCQIVKRDYGIGTDDTCDENLMAYELLGVHSVHHYSENANDEFDFVHTFQIRCPDGETIETDVVVTTTTEKVNASLDDAYEDAFAEALVLVEEIAALECATCPDPPLIS